MSHLRQICRIQKLPGINDGRNKLRRILRIIIFKRITFFTQKGLSESLLYCHGHREERGLVAGGSREQVSSDDATTLFRACRNHRLTGMPITKNETVLTTPSNKTEKRRQRTITEDDDWLQWCQVLRLYRQRGCAVGGTSGFKMRCMATLGSVAQCQKAARRTQELTANRCPLLLNRAIRQAMFSED